MRRPLLLNPSRFPQLVLSRPSPHTPSLALPPPRPPCPPFASIQLFHDLFPFPPTPIPTSFSFLVRRSPARPRLAPLPRPAPSLDQPIPSDSDIDILPSSSPSQFFSLTGLKPASTSFSSLLFPATEAGLPTFDSSDDLNRVRPFPHTVSPQLGHPSASVHPVLQQRLHGLICKLEADLLVWLCSLVTFPPSSPVQLPRLLSILSSPPRPSLLPRSA